VVVTGRRSTRVKEKLKKRKEPIIKSNIFHRQLLIVYTYTENNAATRTYHRSITFTESVNANWNESTYTRPLSFFRFFLHSLLVLFMLVPSQQPHLQKSWPPLSVFNLVSLIWPICTSGGCDGSQVNTGSREAKEKKGGVKANWNVSTYPGPLLSTLTVHLICRRKVLSI
jgi:hypothetical protein